MSIILNSVFSCLSLCLCAAVVRCSLVLLKPILLQHGRVMSEPAATPIVWTIRALLTRTTEFLAKKGTAPAAARLEAQLLLAHVLRCKKVDLLVRYDEQPSEQQR